MEAGREAVSHEPEIVAIIRLRLDIQELLQAIEDRTAGEIGELTDAVIERVRAVIRSGRARGRDVELIAALDALIFETAGASAEIMLRNVDAIMDLSVAMGVSAASMFNVPANRIETLRRTFDATSRRDIRTEGYLRWLEAMPETTLRPLSSLRAALADGMQRGVPTNNVADAFLRGANIEVRPDGLVITDLPPIRAQVAPFVRARRVVRTEYARVDNTASVAFSESYGANRYKNLGVGDERQSEECRIASAWKPLSLEGWRTLVVNGLPIGLAPRHVANCRCLMIGVPDSYTDTVSDEQIRQEGGMSESDL